MKQRIEKNMSRACLALLTLGCLFLTATLPFSTAAWYDR